MLSPTQIMLIKSFLTACAIIREELKKFSETLNQTIDLTDLTSKIDETKLFGSSPIAGLEIAEPEVLPWFENAKYLWSLFIIFLFLLVDSLILCCFMYWNRIQMVLLICKLTFLIHYQRMNYSLLTIHLAIKFCTYGTRFWSSTGLFYTFLKSNFILDKCYEETFWKGKV